jgi:abortive infection bacteriophage resistance protein
MTPRPFDKPATTYSEQVAILKQRGMLISDDKAAAFSLEQLNYYRLGAYWLPFEADHESHQFKQGTRLEDVLALYQLDRELRLLVLDAIERVEVSLRAHWAYELAHRHSPHAHLDANLANNPKYWTKNLEDLGKEVKRSDEVFIRHLKQTYTEPLPPVWAVCEVMSLGLLSCWYDNLKPMGTRKAIARPFGLNQPVLSSWMHHLTVVRNVCAHHSRLWNREFVILPMLPQHHPAQLLQAYQPANRKLYNSLLILLYLMDTIAPEHQWRRALLSLLNHTPQAMHGMGFPASWQQQAIWGLGDQA